MKDQNLSLNHGSYNLDMQNNSEPEFDVIMEWSSDEEYGVLEYSAYVNNKFFSSMRMEGYGSSCPKYTTAITIVETLNKSGKVTTTEIYPDGTVETCVYEKGGFVKANAKES